MRQGPKPGKSRKAKPPVARKSPKNGGIRVRDLEQRLAEALEREAEGREQQTATSDILKTISCSPSDAQPVFDMIAETTARLCEAIDVAIFQIDADALRIVVHKGPIPSSSIGQTRPLVRETPTGRAVLDRRAIHVADVQAEINEYPEGSDRARRLGYRTILAAPLLHMGEAIGAIVVRRTDVRPFTERQIALLQTFADQAVIAIENVRLFNETKEALDRQTATSEILRVISQSPTDVQPVFDAIARSARRLCEATQAVVSRYDGELVHLAALDHVSPEGLELARQVFPMPPSRATTHGRVVLDRTVVHMADVRADAEYSASLARAIQNRSTLGVPMLLDGRVIGVIAAARNEVRPFTEAQIELVKTFADQAVIAIENVRLFKELQEKNQALTRAHAQVTESLEQQTATSEILRVISQSPTDVQPVFDVVAESAARLCESFDSAIWRPNGDRLVAVAHYGPIPIDPGGLPLTRDSVPGRALLDGATLHLPDLQAEADEFPVGDDLARRHGFRTVLNVPLMRDGVAMGVITLRRTEVKPFTDRQVVLLKTFADQAVIAIENVRLFNETKEALEQQTATSQILGVISSSPTDVQPVFDTITQNALKLCGAASSLLTTFDGELLHLA